MNLVDASAFLTAGWTFIEATGIDLVIYAVALVGVAAFAYRRIKSSAK